MELKRAQEIASQVITKLAPYCERIEVAGSIRRRRPFVHDIDVVVIPTNQGQLGFWKPDFKGVQHD
jgi:DNA polymerase/3'-5' exonuclease PolX